jgi:hypothetical protein
MARTSLIVLVTIHVIGEKILAEDFYDDHLLRRPGDTREAF